VCINHLENLVRVIQRFMPPASIQEQKNFIIAISSGGIYEGRTWEFKKKPVKTLGTQ